MRKNVSGVTPAKNQIVNILDSACQEAKIKDIIHVYLYNGKQISTKILSQIKNVIIEYDFFCIIIEFNFLCNTGVPTRRIEFSIWGQHFAYLGIKSQHSLSSYRPQVFIYKNQSQLAGYVESSSRLDLAYPVLLL